MNNFYAKLDLTPIGQLIDFSKLDNLDSKYRDTYKLFDQTILTKIAIEFFLDNKLEPKYVINLLPEDDKVGPIPSRIIHWDAHVTEELWKPVIGAVNVELTHPTESEFFWFNMDGFKEQRILNVGADTSDIEREIKLRGVHYGTYGIPNGAVILENVKYNNVPTLVRTELPHLATFNASRLRHAISIRFKETWTNWEECYAAFEPIMSKNNVSLM